MPKYGKRGKKRNRVGKKFTKREIKVARKAVSLMQKNVETKFFAYDNGSIYDILGANSLVSFNIAYHNVQQGTGDNQMIGEKIKVTGINWKVYVDNIDGITGIPSNAESMVYTALIKTKKYVTGASLTASDICDGAYAHQYNDNFRVDTDECTILKSKRLHLKPELLDGSGYGQRVHKAASLFWGRKTGINFEFKDYSSNFDLKNWNYYVIIWSDRFVPCRYQISTKVTFKDA